MILNYGFNINMSYNKQYYLRPGWKGKQLTVEARNLRARIMQATVEQMPIDFDKRERLEVVIYFYDNWYYKNGNAKKQDLDNRLKFLIDSIFKAINADDKHIFRLVAEKIQTDNDPKCTVLIRNVT